jgi:NADPH:quinone reductase
MIDDGNVAEQARAILPEGVDTALELIGTPTLRATRVHRVVCFTGMPSSQWTVRDLYPIEYLPRGLRLTAYGGEAGDLPARVLQDFLDAVAADRAVVPIEGVHTLDQIREAHTATESGAASGKLVVTT